MTDAGDERGVTVRYMHILWPMYGVPSKPGVFQA